MLNIGICEDNSSERRQLQDVILHILFDREDVCIQLYSSGRELLDALAKGKMNSDLLLLDIHMPEMDGMELAHELRKRETDVDIIFITRSQEHIFEGYRCKAYGYILKPYTKERLAEEINRYLDELDQTSLCLHITSQGMKHRVLINDIRYLESNGRKVIAHLQRKSIEFYEKLDQMEEILSDYGFVRCHQSYLIPKKRITGLSRNGVELGDIQIPVSRKYYDSLRECL